MLLVFLVSCVVFYCLVGLRPVPCVPNVASVSGLSIYYCIFVYCSDSVV